MAIIVVLVGVTCHFVERGRGGQWSTELEARDDSQRLPKDLLPRSNKEKKKILLQQHS